MYSATEEKPSPEQQHKLDLETQKKFGLHVLYPKKGDPSIVCNIDIVAVHGLRGTSFDTWRDEASKKIWLRDFLPSTIPASRIMTFGYDATLFGRSVLKLDDVADALLSGLASRREGELERRPLIFIGHSMGGLVVKKALLNASTRKDPMINATYGIVFMAVPHRGSKNANYASIVSGLVKFAMPFQSTFLNVLKADNDTLTVMSRQFAYLHQEHDIRFISILEAEKTKMPGLSRGSILVVPEYSAQLEVGSAEEARFVIIGADHRGVCRFSNPEDPQYRQVATALRKMADGAIKRAELRAQEGLQLSTQQAELLRSLHTSSSVAVKNRISTPVASTCEWILSDRKYIEWLQDDQVKLLWMYGPAGHGKSTLMSFLIDNVKPRLPGPTICYFYYDTGGGKEQDATALLREVLHQLYSLNPSLIRHAIQDYRSKNNFGHEMKTLWEILKRSMEDPGCTQIILFVDAFDLCEEQSGRLLLTWLAEDFLQLDKTSKLKVFLSSRPEAYIKRAIDSLELQSSAIGNIDLSIRRVSLTESPYADEIERDARAFIRLKVAEICKFQGLADDEGKRLIKALEAKSEKTFLWVSLALQLIEESATVSPASIDDTLHSLPTRLRDVYIRILDQIKPESRENAKRLFEIVAFAHRPLKMSELTAAFAIKDQHRTEDDSKRYYEPQMERTINILCRQFLRVVDNEVVFVHQTARDFLLSPLEGDEHNCKPWYALDAKKSELNISTICISYLAFVDFRDHPLLVEHYIRSRHQLATIEAYLAEHPFLEYAAAEWAEHFRSCEGSNSVVLEDAALRISNVDSNNFITWFLVYWSSEERKYELPLGLSSLHVAAMNGHTSLVSRLLQQRVNLSDKTGRTPLFWAVNGGHATTVELLVASGAKVNFMSTPIVPGMLQVAASGGHLEVVRQLLHICDDRSHHGSTLSKPEIDAAVEAAIRGGHMNVLDNLLDWQRAHPLTSAIKTQLPSSVDENIDNAVLLAIEQGNLDMVTQLMDAGAKIKKESSTLKKAIKTRNYDLVDLLLSKGVDVNSTTKTNLPGDDFTPLQMAAESNDMRMVEILLKANADINAPPSYHAGCTAIQAAVSTGELPLINLLLSHGADPTAPPAPWAGETAMQAAARIGRLDIAQLLYAQGADPNEPSSHRGMSPLQAAASGGHLDVVVWLLSKGVDIDTKDGTPHYTQTAWQLAKKYPEVRKCLQEAGARCIEKKGWDYEGLDD